MNKPKPLKTYNLKLFSDLDLDKFQRFQNLVVYKDEIVTEALMNLCNEYLNLHSPNGIVLVTEAELNEIAKQNKLNVSRSSLRKYRELKVLQDPDGATWWWKNKDGSVVYNMDKVLAYLGLRSTEPFSRIVKK